MFAVRRCGSPLNILNSFKAFNKSGVNVVTYSTVYSSKCNYSSHKMRFTDYDCIGFDLDNTLARYKVGAMIQMEYEVMVNFLVDEKGYSRDHLLRPFDPNFILKGLIVDDQNGNLLRIASDGYILKASHGTQMLSEEDIAQYYPTRHWDPADLFARDPLITWNGPYAEKMRTLLDYYDIAASLVFARAIDSIDQKKGHTYDVWQDIQESLQLMFNRDHFSTGKGVYFARMKDDPNSYYYKCSEALLVWLKQLKSQGKRLFLITGSHVDFASHTASHTLGVNWREYFDIVVCYAKKPGFFTIKRDFIALDGDKETGPVSTGLQLGGIYTHGNWPDLRAFLDQNLQQQNPKYLYVGDNLIQDIFTPNIYANCDTVTVCEELEAEGIHGHQKWHPDQQFLISSMWGSYFHCNGRPTNWHHIMNTHSKLCVPSMEYVATFPVDHTFEKQSG